MISSADVAEWGLHSRKPDLKSPGHGIMTNMPYRVIGKMSENMSRKQTSGKWNGAIFQGLMYGLLDSLAKI